MEEGREEVKKRREERERTEGRGEETENHCLSPLSARVILVVFLTALGSLAIKEGERGRKGGGEGVNKRGTEDPLRRGLPVDG